MALFCTDTFADAYAAARRFFNPDFEELVADLDEETNPRLCQPTLPAPHAHASCHGPSPPRSLAPPAIPRRRGVRRPRALCF